MKGFDIKTLEDLKKRGLIRDYIIIDGKAAKKRSKYRNTKTVIGGITFDSAKEAMRYKQLMFLLKHGEIGFLQLQVPYELNPGGTHSLKYVADFVYVDTKTGKTIVEDSKGFKTKEYLKKRRLMLSVHGIQIKET